MHWRFWDALLSSWDHSRDGVMADRTHPAFFIGGPLDGKLSLVTEHCGRVVFPTDKGDVIYNADVIDSGMREFVVDTSTAHA